MLAPCHTPHPALQMHDLRRAMHPLSVMNRVVYVNVEPYTGSRGGAGHGAEAVADDGECAVRDG